MIEESDKQILDRVLRLDSLVNSLCGILMSASVQMEDSDAAEYIFKRLRDHANQDDDAAYSVDVFLARLEDLVSLASMFKGVPIMDKIHHQIRDTYEVLLFNRTGLFKALNQIKKEDTLEGLRENYWMN